MPSASQPCPFCSTPLILDPETAGLEVFCSGCHARLRMPSPATDHPPANLDAPTASDDPPTAADPATGGEPRKSALPLGRSKSTDDEIRRLAGAAAAPGAAHSLHPEEATLPSDHHRTVLPDRRAIPVAAPETPLETGPTPAARPASSLPTRRTAGAPLDPRTPSVPHQPIGPRPDIEISADPLRGPSRFVRPAPPEAETLPSLPSTAPEPERVPEPAEDSEDPVRRGFRLGAERNPHFTPVHSLDSDAVADAWGAKAETPDQAARSRRFISLALVIVLIAAGGVGIYMLRQAFRAPIAPLTDSTDPETAEAKANVMRNVEDAKRVVQRFLTADTLDKVAAEVRHPEVTRPRMERHYAANPLKPRKVRAESQSWSEIRILDTEFIRASMELDDFRVYFFNFEIIPGADPKLDWESFYNWAEIPWKTFLKTPPEQAVDFRVSLTHDRLDQYYNFSFKGRELDLMCFKLEDPEKFGSCWAYCDKDSEAASQIVFNLKRARRHGVVNGEGKTAVSCILRLRFPPEGMKTNQVMIEQFVHDSWILP